MEIETRIINWDTLSNPDHPKHELWINAGRIVTITDQIIYKAGVSGVIVALAYRGKENLPPFLVKRGETFGMNPEPAANLLLQHPELSASIQGAVAFKNGIVLAVSGLGSTEKDTATAFTIGIAAHLIREKVALKIARRIGCDEFINNLDKYKNLIPEELT